MYTPGWHHRNIDLDLNIHPDHGLYLNLNLDDFPAALISPSTSASATAQHTKPNL
jgi:hypothetical protein